MKASPWARCARWCLRLVRLPTWFQRAPTASWGSLVHYWVAPHRQSIDTERKTATTDICVVCEASGARGADASGGRSVRRLKPTSAWAQVPPMRFLSLTERSIGVPGPLDAVSTPCLYFVHIHTPPHPERTCPGGFTPAPPQSSMHPFVATHVVKFHVPSSRISA